MRAWHVWCGLGVVATSIWVVPLREQDAPPTKGDFLEGRRVPARASDGATVGAKRTAMSRSFADRWGEVPDVVPPVTPMPPLMRPLPTPSPSAPSVMARPTLAEHASAPRELCAAHGMRREYYRRDGWLYWRCKR